MKVGIFIYPVIFIWKYLPVKKIIITESQLKKVIDHLVNKQKLTEGAGMTWLTKIKIDSPDNETKDEATKSKEAQVIGRLYNGLSAVEFNPGEWYNTWGKRVNIDEYEKEVHDMFRSKRMNPDEVRDKFRPKGATHDKTYKGFDDFTKKSGYRPEQNDYLGNGE